MSPWRLAAPAGPALPRRRGALLSSWSPLQGAAGAADSVPALRRASGVGVDSAAAPPLDSAAAALDPKGADAAGLPPADGPEADSAALPPLDSAAAALDPEVADEPSLPSASPKADGPEAHSAAPPPLDGAAAAPELEAAEAETFASASPPPESSSEREGPRAPEEGAAVDAPPARITDLLPALPRRSQEALAYRGIQHPSPIQAVALPKLFGGLSATVHSETGSGKTLAFLLPALERVREVDAAGDGDPAVVLALAPTRELAVQILAEAENLCHGELALVTLAAQASWGTLLGATLIVATPQELLEAFDRQDAEEVKSLLGRVEVCILDEFDELLPKKKYEGSRLSRYQDEGMWPTEGVLKRLTRNNERTSLQVIAASATAYHASRVKLVKTLRRDQLGRFKQFLPVLEPPLADGAPQAEEAHEAGEEEEDEEEQDEEGEEGAGEGDAAITHSDGTLVRAGEGRRTAPRYPTLPSGIRHLYWRTPPGGSHALALAAALDKLRPQSALVFVCPNARESVRTVVEDLLACGWSGAMALSKHLFPDSRHSAVRRGWKGRRSSGEAKAWRSANKLHELRETTRMGCAAQWDAPVLVSAEESVRGLHLDAVEAVFILGMPKTAASYMHMAGRTGRLPHPYGRAVLVAHGLQIVKVTRGFSGQTTIRDWVELGRGSPSVSTSQARKKKQQRKQLKRETARLAEGGAPRQRSAAASALDSALGRPVKRA